MLRRVVFFSKYDGASGHNLKKAEDLLRDFDFTKELDLNDLLELYHIKLYFDNEMFLSNWDVQRRTDFIAAAAKGFQVTRQYLLSIEESDLLKHVSGVESYYRKTFWELFSLLQGYKKINRKTFIEVLDNHPLHIRFILYLKPMVNYFDSEIRNFLLDLPEAAELLLGRYEQLHERNTPLYHFPPSLALADKEAIISRYLECKDPNLNYVRLIQNSNSNDLRLPAKVKFKAKKTAEELNDKLIDRGTSWRVGIEVVIDKDQLTPVKFSNNDHIVKASYSEPYLNAQSTISELFYAFHNLFNYTDNQGLITLVAKDSELDVLERIVMKSKNEYQTGVNFAKKRYLAIGQLVIFKHYLQHQRGIAIEDLIENFIQQVINPHLKGQTIRFKFPTANTSYLEKIRVVAPEFEFLLKQYHHYLSDGYINFELLEFSSAPLKFCDLKSCRDKKYIYIADNSIHTLRHYFFSDQSGLYYVEPFNDQYNSLYELLINENVPYANFANYQQDSIDQFVADGYLEIDSEKVVRIKQPILIYLVGILYKDGVLNYWHFSDDVKGVIDAMLSSGKLSSEGTLFTKPEVNYLNYYLNKKEYSNGVDLRNKYMHGTNTISETVHEQEYYILLMLIILSLLKIEDDLLIADATIG
jgi:hypothetical protein